MSAAQSVLSLIQHYQRSIQKYHGNSARILHCINKLYNLPVTVQHLQDTGVGKTINSLRKSEGEVGDAAKALVLKWKQMVEEESENEQETVTNENIHSSYNGDSENKNHRERLDKRSKDNPEKYAKSHDHSTQLQSDQSKNYKRKRESEYEHHKQKKQKSEDGAGLSVHNLIPKGSVKNNLNGSNVSDEEWRSDRHNNGALNSGQDNDILTNNIKSERIESEERNVLSSEDDLTSSEHGTALGKETWHRKEALQSDNHEKARKKETSHKHKSKSSSSTDKSKHPTSHRSEQKESKSSSSSKHREDKTQFGSSSHSMKREGNDVTAKSEDRSKNKEKSKKDRHKDKHRKKDEKKPSSKEKGNKSISEDEDGDGVDSFSGKSFGEALGMMFSPDKSRKRTSGTSVSTSSTKKKNKSYSSSSEKETPMKDGGYLSPEVDDKNSSASKILSLEVDEDFGLPALNPNYKPLPQPNFYNSPQKRYQNEDDDDLSNIMYSKVQRTKVYSGNKTGYTHVPSLFDLCTWVLQENIDALEFTGGVPFDLLKPVLERATPDQLFTLEHFNAYLIEDTDTFWEKHCKKDFRTKKREEMETWRDMYLRCREERENKLKSLTATIAAASKAKELPVRKTKMAYVEGTVKPPRNVARKQAKFGTARPTASSPSPSASSSSSSKPSAAGLSSSFTGRSTAAPSTGPSVSVPPPRGSGSSSQSSSCKPKPKAPLMQKTLQFMKLNRFGKR